MGDARLDRTEMKPRLVAAYEAALPDTEALANDELRWINVDVLDAAAVVLCS